MRMGIHYYLHTSALRLLALRGLGTLCVRTRAFGPRLGEK